MPDAHGVDWGALHARIARATAETYARLHPSEADERRILDERARKLALRIQAPSEVDRLELALFSTGRDSYAIETQYVSRINPLPRFEPLPFAPAPFLGVVNHHGQPLPLVDLRALFGDVSEAAPLSLLLVLGGASDELGVAISMAETVTFLALSELESERLPDSLRGQAAVRGLYQGRRVVFSGKALLEDPRLSLAEAARD
jgi:chemotaxis signal transduction protein